MPEQDLPLVLILAGPTAAGKTEIALQVAERLDAEIICADSRQIYREFDIGTAKPTLQERARAPHHLVDFLDPRQAYSAAQFCEAADALIAEIRTRERAPMIVGGTGLYIRGFVEGWTFAHVPADSELRAQLAQRAAQEGNAGLLEELRRLDPATAGRLPVADRKRIIRALEVCLTTGQPFSVVMARRPRPFRFLSFGMTLPRERLYDRINRRTEEMIAAGWLEEVKRLAARGYDESIPAMESVGYRTLLRAVRGELLLEEAVAQIQQETRRYAKRQLTWFRAHKDLRWIDRSAVDAVEVILRTYQQRGPD